MGLKPIRTVPVMAVLYSNRTELLKYPLIQPNLIQGTVSICDCICPWCLNPRCSIFGAVCLAPVGDYKLIWAPGPLFGQGEEMIGPDQDFLGSSRPQLQSTAYNFKGPSFLYGEENDLGTLGQL